MVVLCWGSYQKRKEAGMNQNSKLFIQRIRFLFINVPSEDNCSFLCFTGNGFRALLQ
jgi:hypothetical protein